MRTFIIRCCNYIQRKLSKKDNIDPNQSLISHLKSLGAEIGENVLFCDPSSTIIDTTNPFLIKIGTNVLVANGFHLMTHDALCSVSNRIEGTNIPFSAPVSIGDNVYIGERVTILMGVTIGNNVIIGAGSIVTKNIPDNEIWAGNPANKIADTLATINKRQKNEIATAFDIIKTFESRYNRVPLESEVKSTGISYLWKKYSDYNSDTWELFRYKNNIVGKEYLKNYIPPFNDYNDFINHYLETKL